MSGPFSRTREVGTGGAPRVGAGGAHERQRRRGGTRASQTCPQHLPPRFLLGPVGKFFGGSVL